MNESEHELTVLYIPYDSNEPCEFVTIDLLNEGISDVLNCHHIEGVTCKIPNVNIWIDEDSLFEKRPLNSRASSLTTYDISISGDAVLVKSDGYGNDISINKNELEIPNE